MRLYDTYSRSLVELPAPPGPGPDVLLRPDGLRARAHRQRAAVRHRHVAALVAARDRLRRRRSSTTSPTSTTRSTTPRRTPARSWPSARPPGTSRTSATSGSGCPTTCRRSPSTSRASSTSSSSWSRRASPTRSRATSTSVSRASPSTAGSRASGRIRSRSRSRTRSRRIRATSRSGRRRSSARTRTGRRRGAKAGPAGTSSARRWPRSCSGRAFEIHGGGLDLVFPHHENEVAQSRALGHGFADIWVHNGILQLARRQDVEVAREHRHDPRGARPLGARDGARLLPRRPLAQADRVLRRDDGAGGRAGRGVPQRLPRPERAWRRLGRVRRGARRRLQHARGARR